MSTSAKAIIANMSDTDPGKIKIRYIEIFLGELESFLGEINAIKKPIGEVDVDGWRRADINKIMGSVKKSWEKIKKNYYQNEYALIRDIAHHRIVEDLIKLRRDLVSMMTINGEIKPKYSKFKTKLNYLYDLTEDRINMELIGIRDASDRERKEKTEKVENEELINSYVESEMDHLRIYPDKYTVHEDDWVKMDEKGKINHTLFQMKDDISFYAKLLRIGMEDKTTQWQLDNTKHIIDDIENRRLNDYAQIQIIYSNILRGTEVLELLQIMEEFKDHLNFTATEENRKRVEDVHETLTKLEVDMDDAHRQFAKIINANDKSNLIEKMGLSIQFYNQAISHEESHAIEAESIEEMEEIENVISAYEDKMLSLADLRSELEEEESDDIAIVNAVKIKCEEIIASDQILIERKYPEDYILNDELWSNDDRVKHVLSKVADDIKHYALLLRTSFADRNTQSQLELMLKLKDKINSDELQDYNKVMVFYDGILNLAYVDSLADQLKQFVDMFPMPAEDRKKFDKLELELTNLEVSIDSFQRDFEALKIKSLKNAVEEYKTRYSDLFLKMLEINAADKIAAIHAVDEEIKGARIAPIYPLLLAKIRDLKQFEQKINTSISDAAIHAFISARNELDGTSLERMNHLFDQIINPRREQFGAELIQVATNEELIRLRNKDKSLLPSSELSVLREMNYAAIVDINGGVSPYNIIRPRDKALNNALEDLDQIIKEPEKYGWKLGQYCHSQAKWEPLVLLSAEAFGLENGSSQYNMFIEKIIEANSSVNHSMRMAVSRSTELAGTEEVKKLPVFKIVLDILNRKTKDDPNKSIAQALIDGTISKKELASINESVAFPNNQRNTQELPEGEYQSQEAMMNFVRTIGPFLSDKVLYHITDQLAEIEVAYLETQAFRTSTLAKCFMIYELERHQASTPDGELPKPFKSHMKSHVLPLCENNWPHELENNVNTFARFNFNNTLIDKETAERFANRVDYYKDINSFDVEAFKKSDLSMLDEKASRKAEELPSYMQEYADRYVELTKVGSQSAAVNDFAGLLTKYNGTQIELNNLLKSKKMGAKQREIFRDLYKNLDEQHIDLAKKWPDYFQKLSNHEEKLAASGLYKASKANAEDILKVGEQYILETQQDEYDRLWLKAIGQYEQLKGEYKLLINKNGKDFKDLSLIGIKYDELRSQLAEMRALVVDVSKTKKHAKDGDTKKQIKRFIAAANTYMRNDIPYLEQIDQDKIRAICDVECHALLNKIDEHEERLQNYMNNPYVNVDNDSCKNAMSDLSKLKTNIETVRNNGVMDFKLEGEFNKISEQFTSLTGALSLYNRDFNKTLIARQNELDDIIDKASDEIKSNRVRADLKRKRPYYTDITGVIKLYNDKINSLDEGLKRIKKMRAKDSEDYKTLIAIDRDLNDVKPKLSLAEMNFNGLMAMSPLLNEFISGVPKEFIPDYQEQLIKFYKDYDKRFKEDMDVVTPLKDKFRAAILGYLTDIIEDANKHSHIAKFLPLVYDVTDAQIKSEYVDLFSDNTQLADKFNQLVTKAVPLYHSAPVAARGVSAQDEYKNMLLDSAAKMKMCESKFNESMAHIHPPKPYVDLSFINDMADRFPKENKNHSEYLLDIKNRYDIMREKYDEFKQDIERKAKSPSLGDINDDLQKFNDLIKELNTLSDVIAIETVKQTELVGAVGDAYKQVKQAHNIINRILNNPQLRRVEELIKRSVTGKKLDGISEIEAPKNDVLVLVFLRKTGKQSISELLSYFENVSDKAKVRDIINDLHVLDFFAHLEENIEQLQFGDENSRISLQQFIDENKKDPTYFGVFQYFDVYRINEWFENVDDTLVGPGLRQIIDRVNSEKLKAQDELRPLEAAYGEHIKFYRECLQLRQQISPAEEYFEGVNYVVTNLYSPNVANDYNAERIQAIRSQFDVDSLVKLAQDAADKNPIKPKEIKIKFGKSAAMGMQHVTEELKQKLGQAKTTASTTTLTDVSDSDTTPQSVPVTPRDDTDTEESTLRATSNDHVMETSQNPAAHMRIDAQSDQSQNNQPLQKYKARLNAALPDEILIVKGNAIIVPKPLLNFIMEWPGTKYQFTFLPEPEPEPRIKILCTGDKMESLVAIIEYYATIREPLQKLEKCLQHYATKDSKTLHDAIENTIKKISKEKCNLKEEIKNLEKINKEHRGRIFNLFTPDNTLAKAIKEINKEIKQSAGDGDKEKENRHPR